MRKIKRTKTIAALAARVGVHRSTLYRWEAGGWENVKAGKIREIAEILDVSVGDLISGRKRLW